MNRNYEYALRPLDKSVASNSPPSKSGKNRTSNPGVRTFEFAAEPMTECGSMGSNAFEWLECDRIRKSRYKFYITKFLMAISFANSARLSEFIPLFLLSHHSDVILVSSH